jgi:hypothetical protein
MWIFFTRITLYILVAMVVIVRYLQLCHFQQYFCYIVVVSFIGGGNRSTRNKPPTCRKSLTNFITQLYRVHLAMNGIGSHYTYWLLWSWSYGIYNYLCNRCISPLMLWVLIPFMARCTRYSCVIKFVSDLRQVGKIALHSQMSMPTWHCICEMRFNFAMDSL